MLGDAVREALARIGVTEASVEKMLGHKCGCGERRRKLNSLDAWARRVLSGSAEGAVRWLRNLLTE